MEWLFPFWKQPLAPPVHPHKKYSYLAGVPFNWQIILHTKYAWSLLIISSYAKSVSESSQSSIPRPLNLYFNNLLIRSSQVIKNNCSMVAFDDI